MAVAYEQRPTTGTNIRLEQLFWAHRERVLRAAYRVTGSMADAEDVAQTVFMRLASEQHVEIDNAESYLYRAAINGALDLLRSKRSRAETDLSEVADVQVAERGSTPDSGLSDAELRNSLRVALGQLSPRAAEMFVLRYLEDHDNAEIARLMGTSRAVVAVMLHQARTRLKKHFRSETRGK